MARRRRVAGRVGGRALQERPAGEDGGHCAALPPADGVGGEELVPRVQPGAPRRADGARGGGRRRPRVHGRPHHRPRRDRAAHHVDDVRCGDDHCDAAAVDGRNPEADAGAGPRRRAHRVPHLRALHHPRRRRRPPDLQPEQSVDARLAPQQHGLRRGARRRLARAARPAPAPGRAHRPPLTRRRRRRRRRSSSSRASTRATSRWWRRWASCTSGCRGR